MPDVHVCDWCGVHMEPFDGFRLSEPAGERVAAFCRLEHIIPWAINGAHWEPGVADLLPPEVAVPERCAQCGEPAGEAHILLVRHRGEHRIADSFCGVAHLLEWAKAGGRWA